MPWCDDCAKFWNPASMGEEGTCPTCGRVLTRPAPVTAENLDLRQLAGEDAKTPWHFKLLIVLVVLYLVWRIVDLIFGIV
jgi:hypothetical protein